MISPYDPACVDRANHCLAMFCFTCDSLIRGLAALLDCSENWVIVTWDYGIFCNVPNFSMQERLLCVFKPMNANLLLKLANTVMIFYSQLFLRNLVLFMIGFIRSSSCECIVCNLNLESVSLLKTAFCVHVERA